MFGYININREELSDENKKAYQAYYCGLCRKLKGDVVRFAGFFIQRIVSVLPGKR